MNYRVSSYKYGIRNHYLTIFTINNLQFPYTQASPSGATPHKAAGVSESAKPPVCPGCKQQVPTQMYTAFQCPKHHLCDDCINKAECPAHPGCRRKFIE